MFKVFVGGISPEGEHLLTTYLNVFMPDAVIEPLKAVGIKGKIKNHAKRQDVALVIIDESLYQACVGVADDVLSLPKVHKYTDDESLNQFLISKFGRLDGVDVNETATVPPDMLMDSDIAEDETYIPKTTEIFTSPDAVTTPPDKVIEGSEDIVHRVQEDSYENLAVTEEEVTAKDKDSDIIAELQDKLSKSEMLVHNLTLQLEDKSSNSDEDISAFVGRIRELEQQLEEKDKQIASSGEDSYVQLGKVARAEQIIGEFDELKEKLRIANEDKSQLEYDKNNLSGQVEMLHTKIDELKNQVAELELLRGRLSDKESELGTINDNFKASQEELEAKSNEVANLTNKLNEMTESGASSAIEIEGLKSEIASKAEEIDILQTSLGNIKAELESKISELSEAQETIITLRADLEQKVAELSSKEQEIAEASKLSSSSDEMISELRTQINTLSSQISELEATISAKDEEIETSKANVTSISEELEMYKSEVDSLTIKISDKDVEIQKLQEENSIASSNNEVQTQAVDKVITEKNELEDKLVETETKRLELEKQVEELQNQLETANNDIVDKSTSVIELKSKCDSYEEQIQKLQDEAITAKADEETLTRLEQDLLEERKKSARLTSEVEVLRKTDDSGKTSELRIEIARLKSDLESAKSSSADAHELEICQNELQESRERCSALEMDIAERDDTIKELESGVFGRMAGVAFSKAAFDINLPNLVNIPQNFYCVACGSNESSLSLYQLLKKSCAQDANKRTLILDLTTDSYIDREFGIQKATSPVAWLEGSNNFKNFIAQTRYPNVRVLTTALSYLNELSLLNVDWQKRLTELSGFNADTVIINVGCLNEVVSKVLFNMFSKSMTSYVITKATPINLRSVILNLTGFREISHFVTVTCVGFDEKASRNMYQRLVAKYKAQILSDTDTLKL